MVSSYDFVDFCKLGNYHALANHARLFLLGSLGEELSCVLNLVDCNGLEFV